MKRLRFLLLLVGTVCSTGCYTYTSSSGKKHIQLFPVKEKLLADDMDTSRFVQQPFVLSDYNNKIGYRKGKKVVEGLSGNDLQTFAATNGRYIVYILNPQCMGSMQEISKLDSLSRNGVNVVIVSMRNNYRAIDHALGKTTFAAYPYYTILNRKYTSILLEREKGFKSDACKNCYQGADMAAANYLLIDSGKISPIRSL